MQGYALRELHDDFFRKYSVLEPKANDVEELVALLSKTLGVSEENWQIGNSKVHSIHVSCRFLGAVRFARLFG